MTFASIEMTDMGEKMKGHARGCGGRVGNVLKLSDLARFVCQADGQVSWASEGLGLATLLRFDCRLGASH